MNLNITKENWEDITTMMTLLTISDPTAARLWDKVHSSIQEQFDVSTEPLKQTSLCNEQV
jgi:hypothetical protein